MLASEWIVTIRNTTRPRAPVQNQQTWELISEICIYLCVYVIIPVKSLFQKPRWGYMKHQRESMKSGQIPQWLHTAKNQDINNKQLAKLSADACNNSKKQTTENKRNKCNRVYCIHVPGHDPITFSFRFLFLFDWVRGLWPNYLRC